MPNAMKCKIGWKKMGYKSMSDCMSYGKKKVGDLDKDGKMSEYESKRQAAIEKNSPTKMYGEESPAKKYKSDAQTKAVHASKAEKK